MNKLALAALSIVVACGAVLLCSNQQYCTDILDSLLDKAFAPSDELDVRNASMTSLFKKIAQNVVLKAPSGPETTFNDIWKDQRSVIVFFRRFG